MSTADELARVVRARGVRVAVAESLTSGMLASQVGSGEGSSEWFAGGIVAYGTDVKERVLGLTPGTRSKRDPTPWEHALKTMF